MDGTSDLFLSLQFNQSYLNLCKNLKLFKLHFISYALYKKTKAIQVFIDSATYTLMHFIV